MNKTILIFLIIFVSSCTYKFVEPEIIDENAEISFKTDILPIFNDNNKCTACHNGNTPPDLTPSKAYDELSNMNLYDVADPDGSKIYYYPMPGTDHKGNINYTDTEAQKVLIWITQGANNN